MKALIISGGKKIKKSYAIVLASSCDYIICVDKGLKYANEYGINPDYILGDMDSVDPSLLNNYSNIEIFPTEKDNTDTKIGINKALELACDEIDIICGVGSRLDHSLSNIYSLLFMENNNIYGRIIDDNNIVLLCSNTMKIQKDISKAISIIPISERVKGLSLKGFKYTVENLDVNLGWDVGISNEIIVDEGIIELRVGKILVIIANRSE